MSRSRIFQAFLSVLFASFVIFAAVGLPGQASAFCLFGVGTTCAQAPAAPPATPAAPTATEPVGVCYLDNQVYSNGMTKTECDGVGGTWSATAVPTAPSTPTGTILPPPATAPTVQPPPPVAAPPAVGAPAQPTYGPISYTPINPLPGVNGGTINVGTYLTEMYTFTIGFIIIAAFLMLTYGGFQYVLAATTGGKQGGKDIIWDAIFGLVIALASYLILYTINPDLLNLNIFRDFGAINVAGTGGGGGGQQQQPQMGPNGCPIGQAPEADANGAASCAPVTQQTQAPAGCDTVGSATEIGNDQVQACQQACTGGGGTPVMNSCTNTTCGGDSAAVLTCASPQTASIDGLQTTKSDASLQSAFNTIQNTYNPQIAAACAANPNIPNCPTTLASLCSVENPGGNPNTVGPTGDVGVCQVQPTATIGCNLSDPNCNVNAAAKNLGACFNNSAVGGNTANAIACYNAGQSTGASQSGKTAALAPSKDCPGELAYQCTTNPGGLIITQHEVANTCEAIKLNGGSCG